MINCSLCDHIQYTLLGNTNFSFYICLILFAKSFNAFIFPVISVLMLLHLPPTITSLLLCLRRTRVVVVEFAQPPSCSLLHSLALLHTSLICIAILMAHVYAMLGLRRTRVVVVEFAQPPSCSPLPWASGMTALMTVTTSTAVCPETH